MIRIAHIINPVIVKPSSDLYYAQPITFETMRRAKAYAEPQVSVTLYSTQYPEDHPLVPDDFVKTPDLSRSVLDVNSFDKPRKLPLIADIIAALYQATDADYLVYTNVDIAVMPQFYETIAAFIKQGKHDALIINRRRVSSTYTRLDQIPQVQSDIGLPHPGFDCFVFHRSLYPQFTLSTICVGIPFIGIALAHNLFAHASNLKFLHNQHLTIHIGKLIMKAWGDQQYFAHNKAAFQIVKKALLPIFDIRKFPYAHLPWYRRYSSWLLNPAMQIDICRKVEWRAFKEKWKYGFYEFCYSFIWGWK